MIKEIWKWHPDYVGYYKVSNKGRVKSVDRIVACNGGERIEYGKLLKLSTDHNGYLVAALRKLNKGRHRKVHQLVLEAFGFFRTEEKNQVRHLDDDKTNNVLSNLKWGTYKANTKDRIKAGTQVDNTGSANGRALLNDKQVIRIYKKLQNGERIGDVANEYDVNYQVVKNIKYGATWNHLTNAKANRNQTGNYRT